MNPIVNCDRRRIEQFLESDHYRLEEEELIAHLDSCVKCREYMESCAADPETWQSVTELLKPSEFDSASSAMFSAAGSATQIEQPTAAVQDVLNALAPTDDPHRLGRIGTYEVAGVIGFGAMGVVLKAIDPSLDRVVAVKVMAPRLANNETARKRFSREAKAAAAVLHPNVIPIHSVASESSLPYLVMAYVRGGSLQKRLEQEAPLSLIEILRIGSQIAAGLAAAHEQGLVHRDIKPENILLEEGVERVSITDFGLARAVDDNTVTQCGVIAGTPMYMSPEQARGEQVDQQSDLFSLGSVLYALCTGRPPYRADSSYGVMRRIIDESPTPIRKLNPEIPEWFAGIVARLMAKNKADRFATASEVHKLLDACLSHVQQPHAIALPDLPGARAPEKNRSFFSSRVGILTMFIGTSAAIVMVAIFGLPGGPSLTITGPKVPATNKAVNAPQATPYLIVETHKGEGSEDSELTHHWKLKGKSVGKVVIRILHIEDGKTHVQGESVFQSGNENDETIEVELHLIDSKEPLPTAGKMLLPTLAVNAAGLQAKSQAAEKVFFPANFSSVAFMDQGALDPNSHILLQGAYVEGDIKYKPTLDSMLEASKKGASFLVATLDWQSVAQISAKNAEDQKSISETKDIPEKPVTKLSDLKDGDYYLQVTQQAKSPRVQFPSDFIPDDNYGPADGKIKTIRLQFLDKGARVRIIDTEVLAWSKVPDWDRTKSPEDWLYENKTGEPDNGMGKLLLKQKGDTLVATIDVHGSGFPILFSCRGSLVAINEANRSQIEANAVKTLQLEDGDYEFQVSHIAEDPGVETLESLIPDADYKPVKEVTYLHLQFSNKTFSVKIKDGRTPAKIGGHGVAKKEQPWEHLTVYEVTGEGFEPGELTVQKSGTSLSAYYKVSGPSVPVLACYRGIIVKSKPAAANNNAAIEVQGNLQGKWQAIYAEQAGEVVSRKAVEEIKFEIDDNKLTRELDGQLVVSTFTVNKDANPITINIQEGKRNIRGIIELRGDTLRLCTVEEDAHRPQSFDTEPKIAGSSLVLKRVLPAASHGFVADIEEDFYKRESTSSSNYPDGFLTVEDAKQHVQDDLDLNLTSVTQLSVDVAQELAKTTTDLWFSDLDINDLEPAATKALLQKTKGTLYLEKSERIFDGTAKELSAARCPLSLAGVNWISEEDAVHLAKIAQPLKLGLKEIDLEVATNLAKHREWLVLHKLKKLDAAQALALAQHPGRLSLDGLITITPEVGEALGTYQGERLDLNSLAALDLETAQKLSAAKCSEVLSLDGLESITPDVIAALAKGNSSLSLQGLIVRDIATRRALDAAQKTLQASGKNLVWGVVPYEEEPRLGTGSGGYLNLGTASIFR